MSTFVIAGRTRSYAQWRWGIIGVFLLASSYLNFLDRQLLAAVAPAVRAEFGLSNGQYGELISVFSIAYALATPFFGILVDLAGLTTGVTLAVAVWSLASSATGFARNVTGLVACRGILGMGESASIPCASKATATWLPAEEFGFANAVGSVAVTLGSISAPLLVSTIGVRYGWRSVFVLTGGLGVSWLLLWRIAAGRARPEVRPLNTSLRHSLLLLRDVRLWGLALGYGLVLAQYTFWLNWTTLYFVEARHLSMGDANGYFAWLPPVFASLGGFSGAGLAFLFIRRSMLPERARIRVLASSLPLVFFTALVPWSPSPELAALAIGLSLLGLMSMITAANVLPVDIFGVQHAAFSVSLLACSYALMQTVLSPLIGSVIDHYGFTPVCLVMPILPLAGVLIARASVYRNNQPRLRG